MEPFYFIFISSFLFFLGSSLGPRNALYKTDLLGVEASIVILHFPIFIIFLPWESKAAYRTPWSKVVKFGTLILDRPMIPHSKFVVASS